METTLKEFDVAVDETVGVEPGQKTTPDRKFGSAPPKKGICRRCGENKPINRLMLCYGCWVKTVLEEKAGWREGMPHPDWCDCSLSEHGRKSNGN